jgi:hypothetical protein
MSTIKEQIQERSFRIKQLEIEIEKLRGTCPHPSFERGYSIVACICEVLLCTECGEMKPLPPQSASNKGFDVYEIG